MSYVSAQGIDERMINVHYYYYYVQVTSCICKHIFRALYVCRHMFRALTVYASTSSGHFLYMQTLLQGTYCICKHIFRALHFTIAGVDNPWNFSTVFCQRQAKLWNWEQSECVVYCSVWLLHLFCVQNWLLRTCSALVLNLLFVCVCVCVFISSLMQNWSTFFTPKRWL